MPYVLVVALACGTQGGERRADPIIAGPSVGAAPIEWRALPAADYQQPIGTPHPVRLFARAANGRWIVACQARGELDLPYLFRGGGEGQAIGELVSVSPDDRWIVVFRDGALFLIDDMKGAESRLARADTRPDASGVHRSAAFDGAGQYLVYLAGADRGSRVVIRDLARQREREIAIPGEQVFRIIPEPSGGWVRLVFARRGEGDLQTFQGPPPPAPRSSGHLCGDLTNRVWMFGLKDTQAWLELATGSLRVEPDVLARLGDTAIARTSDGGLQVGAEQVVPGSCDPTVLAVSEHPLRIVATCADSTQDSPVEMFGPGFHVTLGGPRLQRRVRRIAELLTTPYVCPTMHACFTLEDGKQLALRGLVRANRSTHILTEDREGYLLTDSRSGITRRLSGPSGNDGARTNDIVSIDTAIVDLAQGRILGGVPREPLAVDQAGRALVASDGERRREIGPLRWVSPQL